MRSSLALLLLLPEAACLPSPETTVEVDVFESSVAVADIHLPDGTVLSETLVGSTTTWVFFEGSDEGDAADDDGDGRGEVTSELISMELAGSNPILGPMVLRLNPAIPSLGAIEESVDALPGRLDLPPFAAPGATADSFFDVYFEIEIGGSLFHTLDATRLSALVHYKPAAAGDVHESANPVELFDAAGSASGRFLQVRSYTLAPTVEVDVFEDSVASVDLALPDGTVRALALLGPTSVHAYFEGPEEGDAVDDNRNGLDEVVNELSSMELATVDADLGAVTLRPNPAIPSLGAIEESVDLLPGRLDLPPFSAPGATANSFFDVFFEIELEAIGVVLHTIEPVRVSSSIRYKPAAAGDVHEGLQSAELYDADGNATGFFLDGASLLLDPGEDGDEDGPSDDRDNCVEAPNPTQLDSDDDGFGNACDCDFDNDGYCDIEDFAIFLADFVAGVPGPAGTDMNGDETVSIADFAEFVPGFQTGFPGPSAFAP